MYIYDALVISPQATFSEPEWMQQLRVLEGLKYQALEPDYSGSIKPAQLRRMGKALRMGVGCGAVLLEKHGPVDGILIGTSEGGLEGCIQFLNQIVDYDEGTLTPTNFIQSTPNALAGQLALMSGCTAYNVTHVNRGLSFENALIDALMLFEEGKAGRLLVGSVEEISAYNFNIEWAAGNYKEEVLSNGELLNSGTRGTVAGEGAALFILDAEAHPGAVRVADVLTRTAPEAGEMQHLCEQLLRRNGLEAGEVDAVLLGVNGDAEGDAGYYQVAEACFSHSAWWAFKPWVGEYPTATGFALKMAFDALQGKEVPDEMVLRKGQGPAQTVLIYNHYKNFQHSLILLKRVGAVNESSP